jgi:hypothetical protein
MGNILDGGYRSGIIGEIQGEENEQRKEESLRRFEIYRQRQRQFILERLEEEFSVQTVREMRTITSINLTKRIIDEMASIYKTSPEREYTDATEAQESYIDNLYKYSRADVKLKAANRFYKLEDQCAIQVIPKDGLMELRVLLPHHYDVIPDPNDPEKGVVYIINILDKSEMFTKTGGHQDLAKAPTGGQEKRYIDSKNQKIGDPDDYQSKTGRFVWWSKDYNFITNEKGAIIDSDGNVIEDLVENDPRLINPLGKLPFVDVAGSKDFEYWVRSSNGVVDFSIDFGVLLSDTANINRLQGYSQAVIAAESIPAHFNVGPHNVLHLPLDPANPEIQPSFQFATPSPDMQASLDLLETYIRFFLSTQGMDAKTVSGKSDGEKFSSGIERLLAMVEKFEASQDDQDLFRVVEDQVFDLMRDWSNLMLNVPADQGGMREDLGHVKLDDKIKLNVQFFKPQMLQTETEKEDSVIKLLDAGLLSRNEAIQDLRGVDEDKAQEIIDRIDEGDILKAPDNFLEQAPMPPMEGETEDVNEKEGPENGSEADN